MGIRKIEVKGEYLKDDEREFLFVVKATARVLHYDEFMVADEAVARYIAQHPAPKDRCFDIKTFQHDLAACDGYISIVVEKEETADYVTELIEGLL